VKYWHKNTVRHQAEEKTYKYKTLMSSFGRKSSDFLKIKKENIVKKSIKYLKQILKKILEF